MGLFDRFKKPAAPAVPTEVTCPGCGHAFMPPRIMMVTQAVVAKYGPNPVQCPKCQRIWSRGK